MYDFVIFVPLILIDLNSNTFCTSYQELSLPDVPLMMTLLDERPSGKLCVSYQKQAVVDAVDEIKATTQRIPNLDIAKVSRSRISCTNSISYLISEANMLVGLRSANNLGVS